MDMNKDIATLPSKSLKTRPYNIDMEKKDLKTRPYSIDMEKKDLKRLVTMMTCLTTTHLRMKLHKSLQNHSTTKNWKMGKCKTQTHSTQEC